MSRQKWVAAAVLAGAVVGCQSVSPPGQQSPHNEGPPTPRLPSTTVESSKKCEDGAPVPRSQSPDVEPAKPSSAPITLLNLSPEAGAGQVVTAIRATVNGVPILDTDLRTLAPSASPEDQRKALEMLIERELVLQDCYERFGKGPGAKFLDRLKDAASKEFDRQVIAKTKTRLKMKTDDEFKTWLKSQGVTLEALRKQWEKQFIYQQYLQFRISPALEKIGHVELKEYYDAHPDEFDTSDSVQWQDIFVATGAYPSPDAARKAAEQVRDRMRQGEDIAKLLSLDNGDSSYRNGDGLGRKRGEIKPPEAEAVLFKLKEKETAVVPTGGGYHVVRVVKREFAGKMPFDEKTQGMIRDKLKSEVFAREAKRFVNDLKRKAAIEIATESP